jgi:hypothetical protein
MVIQPEIICCHESDNYANREIIAEGLNLRPDFVAV